MEPSRFNVFAACHDPVVAKKHEFIFDSQALGYDIAMLIARQNTVVFAIAYVAELEHSLLRNRQKSGFGRGNCCCLVRMHMDDTVNVLEHIVLDPPEPTSTYNRLKGHTYRPSFVYCRM
jgi:hypothetical protein